jgi:hypothetical protein
MDETIRRVDVEVEVVGITDGLATPWGFNYEAIRDVDINRQEYTRSLARNCAASIKRELHNAARAVMSIGRDLMAVKEYLPNGMFIRWIEVEFSWKLRTAQRYMSVAQRFANTPHILDLGIANSILFALAAPNCPDEAVAEIVRQHEKGTPPTHREALTTIEVYKEDRAKSFTPINCDNIVAIDWSQSISEEHLPESIRPPLAHPPPPVTRIEPRHTRVWALERATSLVTELGAEQARSIAEKILEITSTP